MQGRIVFWQTTLLPGITAHPTPGHLLVIAAMWRRSKGEHRVLGTILFTALVQFPNPKLQLLMMSMPMLLRQRKNSLRAEASNFGSNFALSGVGHLRAADQGYAWVPVDYRWREPKGFIAIILAT